MFKLQLKIQGTYQVSWTPPSLPLSDGIWWHLISQVAQSRDHPSPPTSALWVECTQAQWGAVFTVCFEFCYFHIVPSSHKTNEDFQGCE